MSELSESEFSERVGSGTQEYSIAWLDNFRRDQQRFWHDSELPKPKSEHWKYTSLRALKNRDFFAKHLPAKIVDQDIANKITIEGLQSIDLVFVNGHFDQELSTKICDHSAGFSVNLFSQADEAKQAQIRSKLGSVVGDGEHPFVKLSNCQISDGVFLHIGKHAKVDKPIRLVNVVSGPGCNCTISPRIFISVDEGAELTLIEHFVSDTQVDADFVNAVSEIEIAANAKVEHYRLHMEHESALHIGGVHVNLGRDSTFDSFQVAMGAQLKRIDIVVNLVGKGAHCELKGIYLPSNKQHVDFHTCVEHKVPNCTSNAVFRGIISDRAKAVFNGRIHIHADAQKTIAQLSNKNLLTSNQGEIDTKPELEIYADDVQCAHGATVAQLDESAMHYLATRGISPEQARVMLSFGFINELISTMKNQSLADHICPMLTTLFFGDEPLSRHVE